MRTKYFIILLIVSIFGFSCHEDEVVDIPVPEEMVLYLDLEDHVYKVDQDWNRWDVEITNCEPRFQAEYAYDSHTLFISFCENLGTFSPDSFTFIDDYCVTAKTKFATELQNGRTIVSIQVPEDFHNCLYEQSDWIELKFDFFYE